MTTAKKTPSREKLLLDIIQRVSTEATDHMVAVTEAIGELRSYIDAKLADVLSTCNEGKERAAVAVERQNTTFEKIDNVAQEVAAAKVAIEQLAKEVIELEKCAAKPFDWKTKWWQSKEFFLIIIIIMLIIILASHSGVNMGEQLSHIFKIFGLGK